MALSTSYFDATGTEGLLCSVAGLMPQRVSFVVSSFPSIMLEKFVHVSAWCLKSERPFLSPAVSEAVCPSEVTVEGLMAAVGGVVRGEFCGCVL